MSSTDISRIAWSVLALALGTTALLGCGGSRAQSANAVVSTTTTPTNSVTHSPGKREARTLPALEVTIPVLTRLGFLPSRYTCDGDETSFPLSWHGVPAHSEELMLFVVNLLPVHNRLFFDWAVAGLQPRLHGLAAGSLPAGAVVGRNSFGAVGYRVCPASGKASSYLAVLFALPRKLHLAAGFSAREARLQALSSTIGEGLIGAAYAHR
jgi:phosphatidylethanolamine-binding protein (PEBP) family uncharacterized protein